MKWMLYFLLLSIGMSVHAKEWKNFKAYKNETQYEKLPPSHWLKSDRIHNTMVWQLANTYNLENNRPQEYKCIIERRDFYKWIDLEVKNQGHEVVWFKMVYFISKKLSLMETIPYAIFSNKKIMMYASSCSESVFNNAFIEMNNLLKLDVILKEEKALQWDKKILYKEQYLWVDDIINAIDSNSLKKIERILQGRFMYSLIVPKEIRFNGNLSSNEARYNYALYTLRTYCKKHL